MIEPRRDIKDPLPSGIRRESVLTTDRGRRRREGEHWSQRRDLERQLHDGPALRIAALTLRLGIFREKLHAGVADPEPDIDDLQKQLHAVQQELRAIADRIYPPLLDEAGLGAALEEAVSRRGGTVLVNAVAERFDPAVEGAAFFAVLEALDHLGIAGQELARPPRLVLWRDEQGLALDLVNVDTCCGAAILERVRGLGGSVEVARSRTTGTIIVRIPCE
jgi:signal transduction histidine kinase